MIGKLEELTLMACVRAGDEAVPSAIYERVLQGQESAAFGAVYTTLTRLAKKGMLAEGVRLEAGRERRVFTITGAGRKALAEAVTAVAKVGGYAPGGLDVVAE